MPARASVARGEERRAASTTPRPPWPDATMPVPPYSRPRVRLCSLSLGGCLFSKGRAACTCVLGFTSPYVGRLYQVEYAMEAISHAGAAVGLLGSDGVVLACEKKVASKLLEPGTPPPNSREFLPPPYAEKTHPHARQEEREDVSNRRPCGLRCSWNHCRCKHPPQLFASRRTTVRLPPPALLCVLFRLRA